MACQESMGPVVDRTQEHLGTSDVAIIRMRRRMLEALRRSRPAKPLLGQDAADPVRASARRPARDPDRRTVAVGRSVRRRRSRPSTTSEDGETAAEPGVLGLRPDARARATGASQVDGDRGDLPRAAGRGDVLPDAAAPRVRRGGTLALVVPRLDVSGRSVRGDPGLSVALVSALVRLRQRPQRDSRTGRI